MRSLKFHLVRAQNVLCFGPDGIEIHFGDHGQIVLVSGVNHDMPGSADAPGSNGAGKSSLQEILSIGLFNTTVKKPKKNKGMQIINTLADKGEVEVQWDDYRLVRSFKKKATGGVESKLTLWKSPDKIWDKSSEVDRLKHNLEDEIQRAVGLSHHAFCNVVVFDDTSEYSFLEADGPTKRQIVENLLDLDQYREYHETAKKHLKDLKERVASLTKDYSRALDDVGACVKRIVAVRQQEEAWTAAKNKEITALAGRIEGKQRALQASDAGAQMSMWNEAQITIVRLADENIDLEAKRARLEEVLAAAREKVDGVRADRETIRQLMAERNVELQAGNSALVQAEKLIAKLAKLEDGTSCPYCHGTVHRANHGHVLEQAQAEADRLREEVRVAADFITAEHDKAQKKTAVIATMEGKIREAEAKVTALTLKVSKNRTEAADLSKLPKPEGGVAEQLLEAEITELRKQLKDRRDELAGGSPYKEIAAQAEGEKADKEAEKERKAEELRVAEEDAPYYQFWVEAFGDTGIRKFVVDGIIPALNDRVACWMEILCEGLIEITFDNTLKETMTRNGNRADYSNTSNGEKRRINLAVSMAFAHVMMLSSGTCPSVVFLDEITGGGIDRAGIPGVHDFIYELAKERQVFVTTHNETLANLMQGCESITLKKQNDITVLAC